MRAALLLAALQAVPVLAQTARGPAITVTYRSETAVYVSAGRAAGLAVGDRLMPVSYTHLTLPTIYSV